MSRGGMGGSSSGSILIGGSKMLMLAVAVVLVVGDAVGDGSSGSVFTRVMVAVAVVLRGGVGVVGVESIASLLIGGIVMVAAAVLVILIL